MSRTGRYKYVPEDGTHIFAVGIAAWDDTCLRWTPAQTPCGGRLFHEPAMARCLECGTLWPVRGGVLRDQFAFEVSSGLSGGISAIEGRRNIIESAPSRSVRKRPLRVAAPLRNARTVYWTRGLRPENA